MFRMWRPRTVFIFWFTVSLICTGLFQFGQSRAMGGIEGLLHAGTAHPLSTLIQEELPGTPMQDGIGHDGQIFYAMGLDLGGGSVPEVMAEAESTGYRYRRIAYPALASGFGNLRARPLLWGMIVVNLLATGVAAGTTALIARHFGRSAWLAAAVLLNPGVWLSARLLTADNLALAAGLVAVFGYLKNRIGLSSVALAIAALSKEPGTAFAASLAVDAWLGGARRRAIQLVVGALLPLAVWWGYVGMTIGNPLVSADNLVTPFAGIFSAMPMWPSLDGGNALYLSAAGLAVVLGMLVVLRGGRFWKLLMAPWLLIAVVSSELVWNFGNNAIRALSPLLTLSVIGLFCPRISTDQD